MEIVRSLIEIGFMTLISASIELKVRTGTYFVTKGHEYNYNII